MNSDDPHSKRRYFLLRMTCLALIVTVSFLQVFLFSQHAVSNEDAARTAGSDSTPIDEFVQLDLRASQDGPSPEAMKRQKQLDQLYVLPRQEIPLPELETTIDYLQARFLDFLNGEEGMQTTPFGGSLGNLETTFNARTTWNRIHQYAQRIQPIQYDRREILQLARRARSNLIAYRILHEQPSLITLLALSTSDRGVTALEAQEQLVRELQAIVKATEAGIYRWLQPRYKSVRAMQMEFLESPEELGIVLSTGMHHFEMAVHAITALRLVGCTLPVEVMYLGNEDLNVNRILALQSMPGVTTVDLLREFNVAGVQGWAVKPFAMLASRFRQVVFVDADALFLQNPEVLVRDSMLLRQYGQLFYHDRSIRTEEYEAWVNWFFETNREVSSYAKGLRFTNNLTSHEMESGVVVVDKSRTGVLHALLLTCQLNQRIESGEVYQYVHGDKETFWISWDLTRVPYRFTPNYGGAIGYKNVTTGYICGGLYHTDEFGRPLWWNGGVLENKHSLRRIIPWMAYDYVAIDSTGGNNVVWEWDFERGKTPFCLGPKNPETEVQRLDESVRVLGRAYIDAFLEITSDGFKKYFQRQYGTLFAPEAEAALHVVEQVADLKEGKGKPKKLEKKKELANGGGKGNEGEKIEEVMGNGKKGSLRV
ncbi:hypothetical protein HDU98_009151 [Podochytrium sp. JEL0797]|nr:hypothetical protein HDU98_009151 [Podochytrium sp. JEL0797]